MLIIAVGRVRSIQPGPADLTTYNGVRNTYFWDRLRKLRFGHAKHYDILLMPDSLRADPSDSCHV